MKLSDSERQVLARMERLVETDDPAFAARMAWPQPSGHRRWAPTRAPGGPRWRALALLATIVMLPLSVALLVLGSVGLGLWAVLVGSAMVLLDVTFAIRWWLARRRSRDWVEGSW